MKKNMRKKLLKFSLFSLLLFTIFSTLLIVNSKIKAVPTSSIPSGYIPYRSEYTVLYFGDNLDNEVYFDTSVSISVPSLSKNVYTTLSTGGWFTYNNVRYNSLYVNRHENGETGEELATVRFYNTASDDISQNILTYDYSLGTYKFSWSTEIKNASPTIIVEDNVRMYNASSTTEGASILNDILFSVMYVKYIPDESTTYNVQLDELSQEGFVSILTNESEADKIKYSINDSSFLYTLSSDFPLTLEGINSITIYNNSSLELGILASHDDSFRILAPGISYEYTIIENTTLYFGFKENSSTDPDNPNNYIITGGYKFNDVISCPFDVSTSSSYSMDLTSFYNYFPYSVEPQFINYQYLYFDVSFVYLRSSDNSYYYIGSYNDNDNTYMIMNNDNRYLRFDSVSVSKEVYDYLNANGTFGTFEKPQVPAGDWNVGSFLLNGLNNFLSFEIYPGFSLISLLNLIVAIPLLIYILKLFLGG